MNKKGFVLIPMLVIISVCLLFSGWFVTSAWQNWQIKAANNAKQLANLWFDSYVADYLLTNQPSESQYDITYHKQAFSVTITLQNQDYVLEISNKAYQAYYRLQWQTSHWMVDDSAIVRRSG